MVNEQICKFKLEKDDALKAIATNILSMVKKAATIKTSKRLLRNSNLELLGSATRNEAKSTLMGETSIGTFLSIFLRSSLRAEKANASYFCKAFSGLFSLFLI